MIGPFPVLAIHSVTAYVTSTFERVEKTFFLPDRKNTAFVRQFYSRD